MYANPKLERKPLSEINVTPLVDVSLTLLLMFIITAPLLQSRLDVNLPKASQSIKEPVKSIIVTITKDKVLYIDKKAYYVTSIGKEIERRLFENRQQRVFIEADAAIAYGFVIEVMDAIRAAGVPQVGLVIEEKTK